MSLDTFVNTNSRTCGNVDMSESLKSKHCDKCGHRLNPRAEMLSRGLVNTLIKFRDAVKAKGVNEIHLQTEVDLTKNEYNNFQKLRYHALVHHAKDQDGNVKAGYWLVTRLGGMFLRNEKGVVKTVFVENNLIVGKGLEMVKISDFIRGVDEDYWQTSFNIDLGQGELLDTSEQARLCLPI